MSLLFANKNIWYLVNQCREQLNSLGHLLYRWCGSFTIFSLDPGRECNLTKSLKVQVAGHYPRNMNRFIQKRKRSWECVCFIIDYLCEDAQYQHWLAKIRFVRISWTAWEQNRKITPDFLLSSSCLVFWTWISVIYASEDKDLCILSHSEKNTARYYWQKSPVHSTRINE